MQETQELPRFVSDLKQKMMKGNFMKLCIVVGISEQSSKVGLS
jgi:hypothetical protein